MDKQDVIRNPLIIALDVDSRERALFLADELAEVAGAFKIGPRLIQRYGQALTQELSTRAPVFIDCKFFDIPSTMEASVRASFDAGASLVTVHALAGEESLKRLSLVEAELGRKRPFKILCVTILTSWEQKSLPSVMKDQSLHAHVKALAGLAKGCGLNGIVCSPEELTLLKGQDLFLVTPGIRFSLEEKGDQKRIMGPDEAIAKGAAALVVGRPIVEARNPKEAALDYSVAIYEKKKPKGSL